MIITRRNFMKLSSGVLGISSLAIAQATQFHQKDEAGDSNAHQNYKSFLPVITTNNPNPYQYGFATSSTELLTFDSLSTVIGSMKTDEFSAFVNNESRATQMQDYSVIQDINGKMKLRDVTNIAQIFASAPKATLPLLTYPYENFVWGESDYSLGVPIWIKKQDNMFAIPEPEILRETRKQFGGQIDFSAYKKFEKYESPLILNGPTIADVDIKHTFFNRYFIRLSLESHRLGACINRNDTWHIGITLRDVTLPSRKQELINLHFAAWWDGWTPCFGIWNSTSGYCYRQCTWNLWKILYDVAYHTIMVAATAAGIYMAWQVCSAIATATATSGFALAVATPGMPPPP